MLKVFIFSWTDDSDGLVEKHNVVVLEENIEKARSTLLGNLKQTRSDWRRASNEEVAKSATVVENELKQGALYHDIMVLSS